jgi:hypothetical protein
LANPGIEAGAGGMEGLGQPVSIDLVDGHDRDRHYGRRRACQTVADRVGSAC